MIIVLTLISLSLHLRLLWFILRDSYPILTKSPFRFRVDYIHQPDRMAGWSLLHF